MRKRRKNLFFNNLFLIFIFSISIGYAFLNAMTSILGTIDIKGNTWNLRYSNINVRNGSVVANTAPSVGSLNSNMNFNVSLISPGDFYEFTVDIVNDGSVNAKISGIEITPNYGEIYSEYINYKITYQNGMPLEVNQLVEKNSFVRIKVRIEYKVDYSGDLTTFGNMNVNFKINYVPDKNTGVLVKDNGIFRGNFIANGSLDSVGTIVMIGNQYFYTIGTEGDNVKLLSMYNLDVGYSITSGGVSTAIANPTGVQVSKAIGRYSTTTAGYGITKFATNADTLYEDSLVAGYVNNYKDILENKYGVEVVEARLITLDEVNAAPFNCQASPTYCTETPYPWIYSTTYWTMSNIANYLYFYGISGNGEVALAAETFDSKYGVRPVIVIPKSGINIVSKSAPVANGDVTKIGTIVTIGSEQFYVMGTSGSDVKLLAMYNLYVGSECKDGSSSSCTPYDAPTGLQNENMKGYFNTSVRHGVTMFDDNDYMYSGSIIEGYVNDYKSKLSFLSDLGTFTARLPTYPEINASDFGCIVDNMCLTTKYPWIYSTSYWTSSPKSTTTIYALIGYDGFVLAESYLDDVIFGVRPVIVLPKSIITS